MADSPEIIEAHRQIVRAARKITRNNKHHPTHLGGCIGSLSSSGCNCGIADLHWTVRRLDELEAVTHHCPPRLSGLTPCCKQYVAFLPDADRVTDDPGRVTCTGRMRDG